jgi:hypothetical protein
MWCTLHVAYVRSIHTAHLMVLGIFALRPRPPDGVRTLQVAGESVVEMTQWGDVLAGHKWERYGLGLMWLPMERYALMNPNVSGAEPFSFSVGHNGCDYGTYVHAAYHPSLDVATSFGMNQYQEFWIDGKKQSANVIFCKCYVALYKLLGERKLAETAFNCTQHQ